MELDKRNIKKILLIITFAILLFVTLERLEAVGAFCRGLFRIFTPVVLGLSMAFIMNTLLHFLENRVFARVQNKVWSGFKRPVCLVLTLLLIIGIALFVLLLVIPELVRTIGILSERFPVFMEDARVWLTDLAERYDITLYPLSLSQINWNEIGSYIFNFFQNGATNLLTGTVNAAASVISAVVNFFLGLIFSLYVLMQKEKLAAQFTRLLYAYLPEYAADKTIEIARLSNHTFSNFISGQFTEAVILGLLCFIGMSIFRFPYAPMISVLIGFTALIPIFGAFIGISVGAFLILMINPIQALWFIIFIIILQQLEGNLIYPHVVGNSVGLPGMWVLVAVTVGGSLSGVLGMLVSVPLCSVLYSLLRQAVAARLVKRGVAKEKWSFHLPRLTKKEPEKSSPGSDEA